MADDHYYCFACGEHGDVIDFVGRLFQLSPYDAARKPMTDFHLSPDKPPSAAAVSYTHLFVICQQAVKAFIGNAPDGKGFIELLDDGIQLRNPLFLLVQLPLGFLGGFRVSYGKPYKLR